MSTLHRTTGGLFRKFFAGIWLTIIAIALSVWAISASYQNMPGDYGTLSLGPGSARSLSTAREILRYGGVDSLKEWLLNKASNTHPEVFVIDGTGNDIAGRSVPQTALQMLKSTPNDKAYFDYQLPSGTLRFFAVHTDRPPFKNPLFLLLRTPLWVHIALALLVTSLVAWALAWYFARPIQKLGWAMDRASEGDLAVRIATSIGQRKDEIGALATRFDSMAEKINGLLARQKRLFHDVSHELRSPLARIEVALALAQKSPDRRQEFMDRIEKEVHTLDTLVDELLTYAKLDENAPINLEPMDAAALLDSIVEDAAFEGSSRGCQVVLDAPKEACLVNGHVDSLARAYENVIRNALRFTPEGGIVRVAAELKNGRFIVRVTDQGPGIPPEELNQLFLPFVRGAGQKTGNGFGLGLAIARRALERHGGGISAQNRPEGGLTMTLTLPALC